jgi:hypothetical protein
MAIHLSFFKFLFSHCTKEEENRKRDTNFFVFMSCHFIFNHHTKIRILVLQDTIQHTNNNTLSYQQDCFYLNPHFEQPMHTH